MHTVGRPLGRGLRRAVPLTLLAAALVTGPGSASADPGELDPTYGSGGVATLNYPPSPYGFLTDTIDLPDGGYYGAVSGWARVAKFDAAGVMDTAYGDGGVAQAVGSVGSVVGLAPDGSLVYADRSWVGSRLLPDGTVDPTFTFARPSQYIGSPTSNGQPKLLTGVGSVAVTSDGAIHVLGIGARCDAITPPPPPPQPPCAIRRYAAEMVVHPDQTITVRLVGGPLGGSPTQGASARPSIVLADDSIVAARQTGGGLIHMTTGSQVFMGSVPTFDLAADVNGNVVAMTVENGQLRTARALVDTATDTIALDTTFGTSGFVDIDVSSMDPDGALASSVRVLPLADGRLVVGGAAGSHAVLARLSDTGGVDTSFGEAGLAGLSFPYQFVPSGAELGGLRRTGDRLVALGTVSDPMPAAMFEARFTDDGALDPTFGTGGFLLSRPLTDPFPDGFPHPTTVVRDDGSIISAWESGRGMGYPHLARMLPNGTPDPSFGAGGIVATNIEMETNAVAVDPSGRIVLVGRTSDGATSGTAVIARFTSAGVLDASFGDGGFVELATSESFVPRKILFDGAGRLLLLNNDGLSVFEQNGAPGPAFSGIGGIPQTMFLNADGTLTIASSSSSTVEWRRYQPDGTLVGTPVTNEFRPQGPDPVRVEADGRVTWLGLSSGRPAIGRVDPAGNLDPTFGGPPTAPPGVVDIGQLPLAPLHGITLMTDDGADGYFVNSLVDDGTGNLVSAVARLTPSLALDPTFGDGGVVSFPTIPQMHNGVLARVPRGLMLTAVGNPQRSLVVQLEPTDVTAPLVTITTPVDGADYSLGQIVTADYSCTDTGGSGVATCAGPVAPGAAIETASPGPKSFAVTATDVAGNPASATVGYDVLAGDVTAAVVGPQVVDTDPGAVGASPAVPLQTRIEVPAGVSGSITVTPQPAGAAPAGTVLLDRQAVITGPSAPSAASPYTVTFTLDAGLLGAFTPADVEVFRDGVPVPSCTGAGAVPDPCVASRAAAGDGSGDAVIVVRTTQFSTWSFGRDAFITSSASPASRAQGTSAQAIAILGDGFQAGATVRFSGTGITVASTTRDSAQRLTVTANVGASAAVGARDITVTNPGNVKATCTGCFTVNARPTLAAASPSSRPVGASHQIVTLTGTAFQPGAVAVVGGTGVTVHSTSFVGAGELTLDVSVDAGAATGARAVTVTNPDGGTATKAGAFTVSALPTVTSVTPASVRIGQTFTVAVNGTGFAAGFPTAGGTVSFGPGIVVESVTRNSALKLTVRATATAATPVGPGNVSVVNPDGGAGSCTACFTAVVDPSVSGLSPASLAQAAPRQAVTISGTGFQPGVTVKLAPAGVTLYSVTWNDPTSLTIEVSVGASAAVGPRDVTVINPDTGTTVCVGCLTVNAKPTIGTLSPAALPRGAVDQAVVLGGTGFQAGAVVTVAGGGVTSTVTAVTPTSITLSVSVAIDATASQRSVTVTNPDGGTVTKAKAFRVT